MLYFRHKTNIFYCQINGLIERKNKIIEVYFKVFVHVKQNNLVRLFYIAELLYNNIININKDHILFKVSYKYHSFVFFKKKADLYLKSELANKLVKKPKK